jgi:hypothetical protein
MSRYTKVLEDGTYVAYGYDEPLQEYFIQLFDSEEECLFSIANYNTLLEHPDAPHKVRYSNSELLEVFQKYNLPVNHIIMLASDLPF